MSGPLRVNETVARIVGDHRVPKKILSLDGGGIRGLISVEVLAAIESILREQTSAGPDFVLADFFDFFAGMSISVRSVSRLSVA